MNDPWRAVPYLFVALLILLPTAAVFWLNGGSLTYSLDDPYIHLALSEGIAEGRYGMEPGEASAPSSSILWPFLLALGAGTGVHHLLPWIFGLIAMLAAVSLLDRVVEACGLVRTGKAAFAAGLVAVLALCLNLGGLVLTGLEHPLQVALSIAVVLGMITVHRGAPVPRYLMAAIAVGPLIRYESAALSASALLLLAVCGRMRSAAIAAALMVALVVGFSTFLLSAELEHLPAPVLEGAYGAGSEKLSSLERIGVRLKTVLWQRQAAMLALLGGAMVATAAAVRSDARLLLAGALTPGLQLAFGKCGGFGRYEVYALASGLCLLLFGLRRPLRVLIERRGALISLLVVSAVVVPALADKAIVVFRSPRAAHNIFQQQVQMHRFVTDFYQRPVAVNDLGRVSYRNPSYVLDLWGLTSEEVRQARLSGSPAWPAELAERHGIELAMIYDAWFEGRVPATWRPVARLHLLGKRITPASAEVSFYATRPGAEEAIRAALGRFAPTLPADVRLEILS